VAWAPAERDIGVGAGAGRGQRGRSVEERRASGGEALAIEAQDTLAFLGHVALDHRGAHVERANATGSGLCQERRVVGGRAWVEIGLQMFPRQGPQLRPAPRLEVP
jgi:hypothetical protein